jgi:hypothetical protein
MAKESSEYKVSNFNYTKSSGETSERELIVMSKPNANLMALDVTEATPEQVKALLDTLNRHKAELAALNPSWKSFKPEGLSTTINMVG